MKGFQGWGVREAGRSLWLLPCVPQGILVMELFFGGCHTNPHMIKLHRTKQTTHIYTKIHIKVVKSGISPWIISMSISWL